MSLLGNLGPRVVSTGLALVALGCGSQEIERYDGAYRQHDWGAADYDLSYTSTIAQHVVHLHAVVRREDAFGGIVLVDVNCSGILIGPDRVLTAAHCVRDLMAVPFSVDCPPPVFEGPGFEVLFDDQLSLDSFTRRTPVPARATGYVSDGLYLGPTPAGPACMVRPVVDAAVVTIDPPIGLNRGWARISSLSPVPDQLEPIVHHPGGDPKKIVVGRVLEPEPGRVRIAVSIPPFTLPSERALEGGSSGSPLLDPDGYVQGVFNEDGTAGRARCLDGGATIPCNLFVSVTDVAASLSLNLRQDTNRFLIARVDNAGNLDASFSNHGTDFAGPREQANAIALRPDGRIVTAGYVTAADGNRQLALAGYDPNGTEDMGFGLQGRQRIPVASSTSEQLDDVAVQVVGAQTFIVAAGRVSNPDGVVVTRVHLDGSPDPTFAVGSPDWLESGVLARSVRGDNERAAAVSVVAASGAIVVAGTTWVGPFGPKGRPTVLRLHADGTRDATCSGDGLFVWEPLWPVAADRTVTDEEVKELFGDVVVTDMALDQNDDIVLVGYAHLGPARRHLWVGRIHGADCSPDTTFGADGSGTVTIDPRALAGPDAGHLWAEAVTVDPAGRILIAGGASSYDLLRGLQASRMMFLAMDGGGTPTALGGTVTAGRWHEVAYDLAVRADGAIVLAGRSYQHVDDLDVNRTAVALLQPNGTVVWRATPDLATATDEWATGVVLDAGDLPILAGLSREPSFPIIQLPIQPPFPPPIQPPPN